MVVDMDTCVGMDNGNHKPNELHKTTSIGEYTHICTNAITLNKESYIYAYACSYSYTPPYHNTPYTIIFIHNNTTICIHTPATYQNIHMPL